MGWRPQRGQRDNAVGLTPHHQVGEYTWWFAEGSTGAGFNEFLTIQNPNSASSKLRLTYFLAGAQPVTKEITVDANSRKTVVVHDAVEGVGSGWAVSTKVEAIVHDPNQPPGPTNGPFPVVVERPMYFIYGTGGWDGGHNTPGAVHPEYTWYFAEGTTRPTFDQYLSIVNSGDTGPNNAGNATATVQVTYYLANGTISGPHPYPVAAKTRFTINPRWISGMDNQDFSTKIESNYPIVAERPMYFNYGPGGWDDGSVVMGINKPEYVFYFAEGWTGTGFDQYFTIQNPNSATTTVTITYYLTGGGIVSRSLPVAANTRATVAVHDSSQLGPNVASSAKVEAGLPIIVERPMYFNYIGATGVPWDGGEVVMGYAP